MRRVASVGTALLVTFAPTVAAPLAAQEEARPAAVAYALVLVSRLNVRAAPGLDAPVVATVERGDTVCVMTRSDDWAEVSLPNAQDASPPHGFVSRGFLSERGGGEAKLTEVGCTGLRPPHPRLLF